MILIFCMICFYLFIFFAINHRLRSILLNLILSFCQLAYISRILLIIEEESWSSLVLKEFISTMTFNSFSYVWEYSTGYFIALDFWYYTVTFINLNWNRRGYAIYSFPSISNFLWFYFWRLSPGWMNYTTW